VKRWGLPLLLSAAALAALLFAEQALAFLAWPVRFTIAEGLLVAICLGGLLLARHRSRSAKAPESRRKVKP
jgi:cation transport ATPase